MCPWPHSWAAGKRSPRMELGPPVPSGSGVRVRVRVRSGQVRVRVRVRSGLGSGSGSGYKRAAVSQLPSPVQERSSGGQTHLQLLRYPADAADGQVHQKAGLVGEADDVAQVDWGRDGADPGLGGATQTLGQLGAQDTAQRPALRGAPSPNSGQGARGFCLPCGGRVWGRRPVVGEPPPRGGGC